MAVYIQARWLLVAITVISGVNCQVSSLFQCQPFSDKSGLVYTPNIPDFYFNDENAANFRIGVGANLTDTQRDLTYIFTIPSESHDCSGTVRSIQYCYEARNMDINNIVNVFNFLVLSQEGFQFTVQNSITIQTTSQDSICTDPQGMIQQICCDNTSLSSDLQINMSSNFTFGVTVINNEGPLRFTSSATQFNVEQFQAERNNPPPNMFLPNEVREVNDESLLLLRLIIESAPIEMEPALTESESESKSESESESESASESVQTESELNVTGSERAPADGLTTSSITLVITEANAVVGISIAALVGGVIGGGVAIILITTLLTIVCIFVIMKLKQNLLIKEPIDPSPKEDMVPQGNAAYISTSPISLTTNESYATIASTVPDHTHNSDELYTSIDGGGATLDVEMQGNEAYSTSRPIPVEHNEAYATTVTNPQSYLEEEDYI